MTILWIYSLNNFPIYLSDPGIKALSLVSPALAGGFFTTEPPGNQVTSVINLFPNKIAF